MYSVKPIGINTKDNDRDVPDGSLLESINMQWRDGSFKPIPERIVTAINVLGYTNILLHKVGDENTINCLGFNAANSLVWFGTITDGVYAPIAVVVPMAFTKSQGMSFTILNGLIYFMGDGSSATDQYYLKLSFNESDNSYKLHDMYAWKSLIPLVLPQNNTYLNPSNNAYQMLTNCGIIAIRYALVLKTGEVVLPSPIYGYRIYGLNRSTVIIPKDDPITNIHTLINLNLSFYDTALFNEEVSQINIYATVPRYISKVLANSASTYDYKDYDDPLIIRGSDIPATADPAKMVSDFKLLAEEPFYLLYSIPKPIDKNILIASGMEMDVETSFNKNDIEVKIDMSSIAAGELMPVDNFSYHKLFGSLSSYNGRLVLKRPRTSLYDGHMRSLGLTDSSSKSSFKLESEDGNLNGVSLIHGSLAFDDTTNPSVYRTKSRGILSYPDLRATSVGGSDNIAGSLRMFGTRKNKAHNLSCAFNNMGAYWPTNGFGYSTADGTKIAIDLNYEVMVKYYNWDELTAADPPLKTAFFSSDNRIQFSQIGENKVWPAANSYRIGEGKLMNIGTGSVNPSESMVISPIIVGTTDGIYTINLDPSGSNFISSITKTRSIPMISEEILEIDNSILFVSDQGLMVFSDGDIQNLTDAYFPQQGTGNYPNQESVFEGYNLLTLPFFGVPGNIYVLNDIVKYMRGSLLAFDGRRNTVWCSNPAYPFSLVYSLDSKQWGMSTLVFNEKQELFSVLNTAEGEIYSRYMVKSSASNNLLLLSGEDPTTEVFYHVLTRPIKFQNTDDYKVLKGMISRSTLKRSTITGYLSLGLWGSQEVNKYKKAFALALKKDDRVVTFPDNVRYHIPVNCRKGKYKTVTVLQAGKGLPESYISSFDFDVFLVDNNKMR